MNTLDRMQEDLALLELAHSEARRLVNEMKLEIALEACPYKLGHRFHSSGTTGAKQCEISCIYYSEFKPYYRIEIKKVKGNGELYATPSYFFERHWDMTEATQ